MFLLKRLVQQEVNKSGFTLVLVQMELSVGRIGQSFLKKERIIFTSLIKEILLEREH